MSAATAVLVEVDDVLHVFEVPGPEVGQVVSPFGWYVAVIEDDECSRQRHPRSVDTVQVIRLGVLADLSAARDVFRSASLSNAGDRADLLAHPEHLILGPEGLIEGRTQVAEEGGSIVGFATWTDADGVVELEDLFVDPGWMRRGIAKALVNRIADVMRARGVKRLEVTANPHAMNFYAAAGFTCCGAASTEFGPGLRMVLVIW